MLTPEFITDRVDIDNFWENAAYSYQMKVLESHADEIDEVESTLLDMMEKVSHERLAIHGLRNGMYILDSRDFAIVREGSEEAYPDDEVYHVVSGEYMNKIKRIMSSDLTKIFRTVNAIREAYNNAGGDSSYLRIPGTTRDMHYFKVTMEEGYLYIHGYLCRL